MLAANRSLARSSDGGRSTAKHFQGLDLFYGANGIRQAQALGRSVDATPGTGIVATVCYGIAASHQRQPPVISGR